MTPKELLIENLIRETTWVKADFSKGDFEVKFTRPLFAIFPTYSHALSLYGPDTYYWRFEVIPDPNSIFNQKVQRWGSFTLELATATASFGPVASSSQAIPVAFSFHISSKVALLTASVLFFIFA